MYTYLNPHYKIPGYKCSDHFQLFQKLAANMIMTMSSVPTNPGRDFLYRRMASEARGDLFVKATCLENSDQSLTLFLTE